jgi:ABC-type amino acid transport substrate-binding protein
MTTVGYGDKAPRTAGGRLVALVWMFVGVVVIATLTGTIASALTTDALSGSIRKPADLAAHRVACVTGSTGAEYLASNGIRSRAVPDLREAMRLVAAGKAEAAVHDAPMLRYLTLTEFGDDVEVLPFEFRRQDYALALPQGSERSEDLNRALLRAVERDAWSRLLARYLGR